MPIGVYKRKPRSIKDRFWEKVDKRRLNDCWEWVAGKNKGYGMLRVEGKMIYSHRISWELHNGRIPKGLFVCHTCDNPSCVNPNHLWLGDTKDNALDMAQKGRQVFQKHPERAARGDRHGSKTHPECLAWGDRNGARTHPEKVARGDRSGARTHPERLARGGRNGSKTHPERVARGERVGTSKLTEKQVHAIRSDPRIYEVIAADFNIIRSTVSKIKRRKTWVHI